MVLELDCANHNVLIPVSAALGDLPMDILSNSLLAVIMLGSTHYIDIDEEQSQSAVIFYEDQDAAFMRFPDGKTFTGEWRFTTDGYFVDRADGPEGEWQITMLAAGLWIDAPMVAHKNSLIAIAEFSGVAPWPKCNGRFEGFPVACVGSRNVQNGMVWRGLREFPWPSGQTLGRQSPS